MMPRRRRFGHARIVGCAALSILQATPSLAEPAGSAPAASYLAQLTGGLALVILTIVALAWLLRRLPGFAGQERQVIEILAVRAVGARERLLLVQVGEEQILVGLTPTGLRHLHTLQRNVVLTPDAPRPHEFATLLQRVRSRSTPT